MKDIITITLAYILNRYSVVIIIAGVVIIQLLLLRRRTRGNQFRLFTLTEVDMNAETGRLIGIYPTREGAKEIAGRREGEMPGCEYLIEEVRAGAFRGREGNTIFRLLAWNESEDGGVRDQVYWFFFTRREHVDDLMKLITKKVRRDKWAVDEYEVGGEPVASPEERGDISVRLADPQGEDE